MVPDCSGAPPLAPPGLKVLPPIHNIPPPPSPLLPRGQDDEVQWPCMALSLAGNAHQHTKFATLTVSALHIIMHMLQVGKSEIERVRSPRSISLCLVN